VCVGEDGLGAFMKTAAVAGGSRSKAAPPGRQQWYTNLETSVLDMLVLADADYMIVRLIVINFNCGI
jgi:hypothetical protein